MHAAHACSKTYFLPLSLIVERYGVAQSLARTYIYTHTNHNMCTGCGQHYVTISKLLLVSILPVLLRTKKKMAGG